jgi:hypothetical protein
MIKWAWKTTRAMNATSPMISVAAGIQVEVWSSGST